MMAVDIIAVYSSYMQYRMLVSASEGMQFSEEAINGNDSRQQLIGIIQLLLILATIVFFIMWFHRAYKNLHRLGINTLQYTQGWAIGGWFVPFLNLVRPYTIMKEIWKNTQEYVFTKETGIRSSAPTIIGWWWGTWLLSNVLGNASGKIALRANSIDQMITSTQVSMFSDAVDMLSMIITLIMVTKMMDYEKQLLDYTNDPINAIKEESGLVSLQ
jgi:hypothetical protein